MDTAPCLAETSLLFDILECTALCLIHSATAFAHKVSFWEIFLSLLEPVWVFWTWFCRRGLNPWYMHPKLAQSVDGGKALKACMGSSPWSTPGRSLTGLHKVTHACLLLPFFSPPRSMWHEYVVILEKTVCCCTGYFLSQQSELVCSRFWNIFWKIICLTLVSPFQLQRCVNSDNSCSRVCWYLVKHGSPCTDLLGCLTLRARME